jgi:hypothetical protein
VLGSTPDLREPGERHRGVAVETLLDALQKGAVPVAGQLVLHDRSVAGLDELQQAPVAPGILLQVLVHPRARLFIAMHSCICSCSER